MAPVEMLRDLTEATFGDSIGVGLDLVDIDLMRSLVDVGGQEFVDAYWTRAEQLATRGDVERLAGRWAAKEAVMKCIGAGVGDVDPIDIEIVTLPSGAPQVVLSGRAAEVALDRSISKCSVSITHESSWAAAIAIAHSAAASGRTEGNRGGRSPAGAADD